MEVCKEMKKLREILDNAGIEWSNASQDNSEWPICRTHFKIGRKEWSVINGAGTYGGYNPFLGQENAGLLEVWDNIKANEPEGWKTAEEVAEIVGI
jgi:hypothetical protein